LLKFRPEMSTSQNDPPVLGVTLVTTGALDVTVFTVSVAALDVVDECAFVNTAWYSLPFNPVELAIDNVPDVAPLMFVNVVPPLVLTCHWIVAAEQPAGTAPSATVNDAAAGAVTVSLDGCVAITGSAEHTGAVFTVSVTAFDVVDECAFVSTASYLSPDTDVVVGLIVNVPEVAPEIGLNVVPPSVETSHWIVAGEQPAGTAPSATVKVAAAGAVTVVLTGCVPITGAVVQGVGLTVNVAALDVVVFVPVLLLVSTASYLLPDCDVLVGLIVNVAEVAPEIAV